MDGLFCMHTLRDGLQHAGIVPSLAPRLHPALPDSVPYRTVESAIRRLLPAFFPAGRACAGRNQGTAPPGGCTVAGLECVEGVRRGRERQRPLLLLLEGARR